jgi:hypothetical protein
MNERESLKPAIHLLSALLKHQVKKLVGEEALQVLSDELFDQAQTVLDTQLEGWFEEPHVKRQIEAAVVSAEDCFLQACRAKDVILAQWAASLPLSGLPTLHASVARLPKQLDDQELESELGFIIGRDWPGLSAGQVEWAVRQYLFCLRNALLPLEKLHLGLVARHYLRNGWSRKPAGYPGDESHQICWCGLHPSRQDPYLPCLFHPPESYQSYPCCRLGRGCRFTRLRPSWEGAGSWQPSFVSYWQPIQGGTRTQSR